MSTLNKVFGLAVAPLPLYSLLSVFQKQEKQHQFLCVNNDCLARTVPLLSLVLIFSDKRRSEESKPDIAQS